MKDSIKTEQESYSNTRIKGDITRESILDNAQHIFAESGFEGASMRVIAQSCSISQALLHFHFGTKEKLYQAVRDRLQEKYQLAILPVLSDSGDNADFLFRTLKSRFQFYRNNPDMLRIHLWTLLEGRSYESIEWQKMIAQVEKEIQFSIDSGWLRSDTDIPVLLEIISGSLIYGLLAGNRKNSNARAKKKWEERTYSQLISVLSNGLIAPSPDN